LPARRRLAPVATRGVERDHRPGVAWARHDSGR
jgi:hypothetical protein